MVVDLQPVNRVVIPNFYPLPNQDDIKEGICGKEFMTMFDGSTFFFQLPIYRPHRDWMVIILP